MEKTLINLFEEAVDRYAERPFLFEKITDRFQETTYKQTREQVYCLGAGLQAIGVHKSDAMALLSEGRNWWIMGRTGDVLRRSDQTFRSRSNWKRVTTCCFACNMPM